VRPLKLSLEGFTSFRERIELDLSGLDLFAITGPTGAGKSSLIDAIAFALYGQVPRVGDDYKQLISHGKERLSVLLEFAVGDERYRIARTARPDRPSTQRLERVGADAAEPVADRVREIRTEIERILGLDYDGFTRSVVLPQGQFDAFLKGEPKERRKILVALLGLGVYERMQQLANQRSAAARAEAEFIRRQLETDFAGATREALAQKQAELKAAEGCVQQAEARLRSLAEAAALAQQVRALKREQARLAQDREAEAKRLEAAQATLDSAGQTRKALDAELAALQAQKDAHGFDEARHAALLTARPRAEQLVGLDQAEQRAAKATAERRSALEEARAAVALQEKALPGLERAEAEAREAERAARAERDAAHREHAALALRQGLKPGDPCPVCAQAVKAVPKGKAPALDAVEARERTAEATANAAREKLQAGRLANEQKKARASSLERELEQAETRANEANAHAAETRAALAKAGFEAVEGDPTALVEGIEKELQALQAAKEAKQRTEAKLREIEQGRASLDKHVAAAAAERDVLQARIAELERKASEATKDLEQAQDALGRLAVRDGWSGLLPPEVGRDEAVVVESLRAERQKEAAAAQSKLATLRHEVLTTEKALVRAAELEEKRSALERDAALARTLADHLKANELIAWIQEEALVRLAEAGSRHLLKLSQDRYTLRLGSGSEEASARAEQDFFVVDGWNADAIRSVRTLSGGETFLASLALALALAESLTELGAGSHVTDALESLFLDEGFGTLDTETLDTVVSALDALHGGDRMVGIVTHVRELAERLPTRLEVRRQNGGSTVAVV
jgi:exonuclease SbcC